MKWWTSYQSNLITFSSNPTTEGIVSYSMRQGERRGSEVDLYDFTYDGTLIDGNLSGGLGQLVDGDEGQHNFRLDPYEVGKRGYVFYKQLCVVW